MSKIDDVKETTIVSAEKTYPSPERLLLPKQELGSESNVLKPGFAISVSKAVPQLYTYNSHRSNR